MTTTMTIAGVGIMVVIALSVVPNLFASIPSWREIMSVENQYYVDKIDEQVKKLRDSGKYPDTTLSNEEIAEKIIQYFMKNDLYFNGLHIWEEGYHDKWVAEQYEEIVKESNPESVLSKLFG